MGQRFSWLRRASNPSPIRLLDPENPPEPEDGGIHPEQPEAPVAERPVPALSFWGSYGRTVEVVAEESQENPVINRMNNNWFYGREVVVPPETIALATPVQSDVTSVTGLIGNLCGATSLLTGWLLLSLDRLDSSGIGYWMAFLLVLGGSAVMFVAAINFLKKLKLITTDCCSWSMIAFWLR